MQKILPAVVIIEINVGATVPINFQGMLSCVHLLLSWSAHFYLAFLGDGCTFFHHR